MSSIKNIASFNQGIKLQKKIREAKENSEAVKVKDSKQTSKYGSKDSINISSESSKLQSKMVEFSRYVTIVKDAPGLNQKEIEEIETNIQSERYLQSDVTEKVAEKVQEFAKKPETIAGFKNLGEVYDQKRAADAERIADLKSKVAEGTYNSDKFVSELAAKMVDNGII